MPLRFCFATATATVAASVSSRIVAPRLVDWSLHRAEHKHSSY
jgi:hypothetical protein